MRTAYRYGVAIVHAQRGWHPGDGGTPQLLGLKPPQTRREARQFCCEFNQSESEHPAGLFAVVVEYPGFQTDSK